MGESVAGDSVRTVLLFLKATAELIHFICKSQVVDGVGGAGGSGL